MASDSRLRVGIVEDNRFLLELLETVLGEDEHINVVATSSTVSEAKAQFDPLQLDAVLLDIGLPDGNGIGLAVTLSRANPKLGVVLLSDLNHLDLFMVLPPEERRNWSYLSKLSLQSIDGLRAALNASVRGVAYIDPALLGTANGERTDSLSVLSNRQFEVLRAVAAGDSNQQIAERLGIATNSVGNHLIAIYDALEIPEAKNPRVAAVLKYIEATRD